MHSGMARFVPHPRAALAVAAVTLVAPAAADAYIGPGAGFAVMSSFLVMLVTMVVVAGVDPGVAVPRRSGA